MRFKIFLWFARASSGFAATLLLLLAAYIRASFTDRPGHVHGYYGYDAFYDEGGRYSAIETGNAWTGDALRYAGVRVGRWTPFSWSVMAWF